MGILFLQSRHDTQLIVEADTLQQLKKKLEEVIIIAQKWYEENSMKNNIGKTEILIVNTKKHKHNIKIVVNDDGNQVILTPSKTIKKKIWNLPR